MKIVIEVDIVPVAKGRPRFGGGRVYTPKKTKDFEAQLGFEGHREMNRRPPLDTAISLDASFTVPVPRSWSKKKREKALNGTIHPIGRPDIDNYLKAVMDALNNIVWQDDSQIVTVGASLRYGETGRIRLEIATLD